MDESISIYINTANPSMDTIVHYLNKHNLPLPHKIFPNKGKQRKIVNLKLLATTNFKRPRFYIDDEMEYIKYANMLFYQCYQYNGAGKILSKSLNIK